MAETGVPGMKKCKRREEAEDTAKHLLSNY